MNECETNEVPESPSTASVEQLAHTEQVVPLEQQVLPQQLPGEKQTPFEQLHPDSIVVERWAGLIFVAVLAFIALGVWVTLTILVFPIWDFRC